MKRILLALYMIRYEGREKEPFLFEYEILGHLENEYTESIRTSYHRSFKRLVEFGLIKSRWGLFDVAKDIENYDHPFLFDLRTKRFKLFILTDKGKQEAEKIHRYILNIFQEFQFALPTEQEQTN